ncbi:hypothetical protein T439DRAFT_69287 [Meredithblackwellia eburnea MCA 4105]
MRLRDRADHLLKPKFANRTLTKHIRRNHPDADASLAEYTLINMEDKSIVTAFPNMHPQQHHGHGHSTGVSTYSGGSDLEGVSPTNASEHDVVLGNSWGGGGGGHHTLPPMALAGGGAGIISGHEHQYHQQPTFDRSQHLGPRNPSASSSSSQGFAYSGSAYFEGGDEYGAYQHHPHHHHQHHQQHDHQQGMGQRGRSNSPPRSSFIHGAPPPPPVPIGGAYSSQGHAYNGHEGFFATEQPHQHVSLEFSFPRVEKLHPFSATVATKRRESDTSAHPDVTHTALPPALAPFPDIGSSSELRVY